MAARKEAAVQPCSRKRYFIRALSREWRRTSDSRKTPVMARTTGMTWCHSMKALRGTARWGWVERPPATRRENPISEEVLGGEWRVASESGLEDSPWAMGVKPGSGGGPPWKATSTKSRGGTLRGRRVAIREMSLISG